MSASPVLAARPNTRPLDAVGPGILRVAAIVGASLLLGGLTSWGQTLLPEALSSAANSSGGWTIPTAVLVALLARRMPEAAVGGSLGFAALVVGYSIVSTLRGFPYDPTSWALIGLVAGLVVGPAALGLRRGGLAAAVGSAVLGGILIGEGIYGLTVVGATTSPVWWSLQLALGAAVVVVSAARAGSLRLALVGSAGAAVVTAAFLLAYTGLPAVLGG